MRVSIHRGLSGQAAAAPAMGNAMLVVTGAEFLLSMVEARWAAKNGDGRKMDAGHKSQQELQKIEQQLKKVQSLDGQDESTRREIQLLQERIELLRKQMSSHFGFFPGAEMGGHLFAQELNAFLKQLNLAACALVLSVERLDLLELLLDFLQQIGRA